MEVNLKHRAISLLYRREHSAFELTSKLSRYTDNQDEIEETISYLQKVDLQSDLRFLEFFIRTHASKWGKSKIKQALKEHKLSEDILTNFDRYFDIDEYELAKSIWMSKFKGEKSSDIKTKSKQYRFLLSRGFTSEIIRKVID
ncbi:regulatory protein RecX [Taylorella equigenitalis]|uniref:Regulatory protein RecX n=1 Tax=Taylorella equigenitalis ATCC 35865 TaxID=743973 RepID=A0ABM5NAI9_9BURK|nr:regulatory protein RecX [Taylorella equigenitalis]AFN35926.1 regulatory protein RecX [Taylorella equigenitalis ATCC 35865]ASY39335.1 RecX family transcriptional regulator [Taylorella equigenitalis]VEG30970.1 Regulatory protein recX [Taylorella equigenitalis ATCC 35865]